MLAISPQKQIFPNIEFRGSVFLVMTLACEVSANHREKLFARPHAFPLSDEEDDVHNLYFTAFRKL